MAAVPITISHQMSDSDHQNFACQGEVAKGIPGSCPSTDAYADILQEDTSTRALRAPDGDEYPERFTVEPI